MICVLFTENVNGILQSEEIYIEILLDTVAHMSPNLLGTNGVKKLKSGKTSYTDFHFINHLQNGGICYAITTDFKWILMIFFV